MLSKKVFLLSLISFVFIAASQGLAATVIDYTYDDLNRVDILSRDDGPQYDYDYDEVGNIIGRTTDNPDTDGDHLTDVDEVNLYGTDRYSAADNDTDGMPDDWETVYAVQDPTGDDDTDGINNAGEFLYDTNPATNDTDGDGVSDMDEIALQRYGYPDADPRDDEAVPDTSRPDVQPALNAYVSLKSCQEAPVRISGDAVRYYTLQAAYNAAPDGATIRMHARSFYENFTANAAKNVTLDGGYNCDYTSNPAKTTIQTMNGIVNIGLGTLTLGDVIVHEASDTDNDTLPDEWEVVYGINPLINDVASDPDGDGLLNSEEFQYGTDPWNPDTDGDGVDDKTEVDNGSDPLDPASVPGCVADGDLAPLGAPDGVVDIADVLIAERIAAGLVTPTPSQVCHGDVAPVGAPDGVIDVADALVIMRMALGL